MAEKTIKARSPRRYVYVCEAQISIGNDLDEARLTNISGSGIQFETKNKLSLNAPIELLWTDLELGIISSTMYTTREGYKADEEFPHLYGAQFHKLTAETKEKLVSILQRLRNEQMTLVLGIVPEASPGYLLKVATQPANYLKKLILSTEPLSPVIAKVIDGFMDYEKKSFDSDSDIDQFIRRCCIYTFQCRMIESLASIMASDRASKITYYKIISFLIKSIRQMGRDVEKIRTSIENLYLDDSEKMRLVGNIEESMKRNFYAEQDMFRNVRKYLADDAKDPLYVDTFKMISVEYAKMLEKLTERTLTSVLTKQRSFSPNPYVTQKERLHRTTDGEHIIDDRPPPGYTKKTVILLSLVIVLAAIIVVIFLF